MKENQETTHTHQKFIEVVIIENIFNWRNVQKKVSLKEVPGDDAFVYPNFQHLNICVNFSIY